MDEPLLSVTEKHILIIALVTTTFLMLIFSDSPTKHMVATNFKADYIGQELERTLQTSFPPGFCLCCY